MRIGQRISIVITMAIDTRGNGQLGILDSKLSFVEVNLKILWIPDTKNIKHKRIAPMRRVNLSEGASPCASLLGNGSGITCFSLINYFFGHMSGEQW